VIDCIITERTRNSRLFDRNDANEVGGSVYQRINERLETGVQLAWTAGSNQTRFALASKYQLDPQTVVSAKVNNICQVGLSFQQVLRPGTELNILFDFFYVF
jgi:hypothetical protein